MPYNETIYNQQKAIYGGQNQQQSGLTSSAQNSYYSAAAYQGAGALAQLYGSYINYQNLKISAYQLDVQASNIELQAKERANQLREQFISNVGNYQFGAAQRGVSVGSGSVRQNIESSAISLGKDIQTQDKSAKLQANALRAQGYALKHQGKAGLYMGVLNAGIQGAQAVGSAMTGAGIGA